MTDNTDLDIERRIDIPEHLKPAVAAIVERWQRQTIEPVVDELTAAGLDSSTAWMVAIRALRTDAARFAMTAVRCFTDRQPRLDFWLAAATDDFNDAVAWFEKVTAEIDAEDHPRCIACDTPIEDGDPVYNDADGGIIHATCCGPDRESYTGPDGEPLAEGEPIPEPWIWRAAAASTSPLAGSETTRAAGLIGDADLSEGGQSASPREGDTQPARGEADRMAELGEG